MATVKRTIETNRIVAETPGHEETGQEGILAGEQELALLEAELALFDEGREMTPEGRRFLDEATATMQELAPEDRQRREERDRGS